MNPDQFKERYPQFKDMDITEIQRVIDDADPHFNKCRWGNFYEQGLAAWVAHEITVSQGPIDTGDGSLTARTSKTIGEVSVTYGETALARSAKNPYMRTVYGQKYLYLARLVGMGAVAV